MFRQVRLCASMISVFFLCAAPLTATAQQSQLKSSPDVSVVRSSLTQTDMQTATPARLGRLLRTVARDIGECQSLRRTLTQSLQAARSAYDVDEGWISLHEICLSQRDEDLSEIEMTADTLRQVDGDSAPLERLRADIEAIEEVLSEARAAHDDLTAAYDRTQELADLE